MFRVSCVRALVFSLVKLTASVYAWNFYQKDLGLRPSTDNYRSMWVTVHRRPVIFLANIGTVRFILSAHHLILQYPKSLSVPWYASCVFFVVGHTPMSCWFSPQLLLILCYSIISSFLITYPQFASYSKSPMVGYIYIVYIYIHTHYCVYIYIHTIVYIYVYMYIHTHYCVCINIYYICICIHTYIHIKM